jgi:beta-galactosidase
MYKANWSNEKFVHITSKRFVDRVDETIKVKVYSNCDQITLYANGVEVAAKASDNRVFIFENVALKSGLNEIKVLSNQDGVQHEDVAFFNKVEEANPSYVAPEAETGGLVANWFTMPEMDDDVEIEEIELSDDVYSTRSSLGELMKNEETRKVIEKYLVGFSEDNPMYGMAEGMSIDVLASMAEDMFTDRVMFILNRELTKIKK